MGLKFLTFKLFMFKTDQIVRFWPSFHVFSTEHAQYLKLKIHMKMDIVRLGIFYNVFLQHVQPF